MAIEIDSVYKEVLSIISNESLEDNNKPLNAPPVPKVRYRDHITPNEFNLFAERAQLDVFENTVHDFKQAWLVGDKRNAELIRERLSPFILEGSNVDRSTGSVGNSPYWIINVYDVGNGVYYEEVDIDYFNKVKAFSSTAAGSRVYFPDTGIPKHHIYYRKDTNSVIFHPTPTANPDADIVIFPTAPKWGSIINVDTGTVTYSTGASTNFSLHKSERGTIVNKILELAGISTMNAPLSEMALRNEATNTEDKIQ